MKVYVAGPYTLGDVAANVRTAILAGSVLLDAGHEPYIPHLSHFIHLLAPRPYETWIRLDNAFLPHCDALVRLEGESRGGDAEVDLARKHGIPVYHSVGEFLLKAC